MNKFVKRYDSFWDNHGNKGCLTLPVFQSSTTTKLTITVGLGPHNACTTLQTRITSIGYVFGNVIEKRGKDIDTDSYTYCRCEQHLPSLRRPLARSEAKLTVLCVWVSGKHEDLAYHLVGCDTPLHNTTLSTTCVFFQNWVKTESNLGSAQTDV